MLDDFDFDSISTFYCYDIALIIENRVKCFGGDVKKYYPGEGNVDKYYRIEYCFPYEKGLISLDVSFSYSIEDISRDIGSVKLTIIQSKLGRFITNFIAKYYEPCESYREVTKITGNPYILIKYFLYLIYLLETKQKEEFNKKLGQIINV